MRAFISYGHGESDLEVARRVRDHLAARGLDVFLDETHLRVGESLTARISEELQAADYLVVLVSERARLSKWVAEEIDVFLRGELGRRHAVLPVKLDETEPDALHASLRGQLHTSWREGPEAALGELARRAAAGERAVSEADERRLKLAVKLAKQAGDSIRNFYLLDQPNRALDAYKNPITEADRAAAEVILKGLADDSEFGGEGRIVEDEPREAEGDARSGYTWVVDPLDGTVNFIHRIPFFCTAIAVLRDGRPHIGVVYDPLNEEMYQVVRGAPPEVKILPRQASHPLHVGPASPRLAECVAATHISSRPKLAERLLADNLLLNVAGRVRHLRALGCGQLALAHVAAGHIQLFFQFGAEPWDQAAGLALVEAAGGCAARLSDGARWSLGDGDFLAAASNGIRDEFVELLAEREGRVHRPPPASGERAPR